jgi:hypothetical protein
LFSKPKELRRRMLVWRRRPRNKRIETMSKESDLVRKSRLPDWIIRALHANRLNRLSTIATIPDNELLKVPGIGPRALSLIRSEMTGSKPVPSISTKDKQAQAPK